MASGNTLLTLIAAAAHLPTSSFATFDARNTIRVLRFNSGVDESANWLAIMPRHYGSGGITVYIHWCADTATSGSCVWEASFERIGEGSQDIDSDGFASIQYASATAPGTAGNVDIQAIPFTDGAQMDSVAVGELFRIKISRDGNSTNATDNMSGYAHLLALELKET